MSSVRGLRGAWSRGSGIPSQPRSPVPSTTAISAEAITQIKANMNPPTIRETMNTKAVQTPQSVKRSTGKTIGTGEDGDFSNPRLDR
jgi:hypothetical protein